MDKLIERGKSDNDSHLVWGNSLSKGYLYTFMPGIVNHKIAK